ncbi:MAG TPA: CBS domain-containing protein, partial [Patescibacteria group bacterium]|nr:CBS domain-containing protein [Patescibacteria group bacterium]
MPNALLHAELADNDLFSEMPVRTVGQIVSGDLLTCEPDLPVAEAARLMRASRCSSVIILRDGFPAGIWTENDALNVDFSSPEAFEQPISAVMTRAVKTIDTGASISEAGVRFKRDKIRHLLVVDDDGHALGMLSQTDVVLNHGVEHYLTFRDVRSVLSKPLTSLPADMPLTQAAAAIRSSNGEAAIVTSPDWPEPGIVTERDIVRMVAERCSGPVAQATSRPVVSVLSTTTLLAARNLFSQHGFRHLAVRDDTGAFIGLLSFSDILSILQYEYLAQVNSALRDRDDALVKSRKDLNLARQVIEATLDGVMIVDDQGLIEYVNPSFSRLTGYAAEDVLGKNPRLLQSGRHDAAFYAKMWSELLDIGHWQGEVWNRRKDGDIFAEWLTINSIR